MDPLLGEKDEDGNLLQTLGRFSIATTAFVGRCITQHSFGVAADNCFSAWMAASCPTTVDRQINWPLGNFSKRSYWRSTASR
jgi:hypothetical protein